MEEANVCQHLVTGFDFSKGDNEGKSLLHILANLAYLGLINLLSCLHPETVFCLDKKLYLPIQYLQQDFLISKKILLKNFRNFFQKEEYFFQISDQGPRRRRGGSRSLAERMAEIDECNFTLINQFQGKMRFTRFLLFKQATKGSIGNWKTLSSRKS